MGLKVLSNRLDRGCRGIITDVRRKAWGITGVTELMMRVFVFLFFCRKFSVSEKLDAPT